MTDRKHPSDRDARDHSLADRDARTPGSGAPPGEAGAAGEMEGFPADRAGWQIDVDLASSSAALPREVEDPEPPDAAVDQNVERLEKASAALREERDQITNRFLRATADLENYRKRVEREREEFSRSALESLFLDIIGVLDNFDRALANASDDAQGGVVEGVRLIHKQLLDLLGKRGLVPMEPASGQFDPHRHEAVSTEAHLDVPHHGILAEVQKGYMFGGRVLRPALVKVSVRPDQEDEAGAEEA